jgi:hypothetical protein
MMVGTILVIMMYKKHTALTFPFDFGSMEAVPENIGGIFYTVYKTTKISGGGIHLNSVSF